MLYGAHTIPPYMMATGWICRVHVHWGNFLFSPQKKTTTTMPRGNPTRISVYWPEWPKIFCGPTVPHSTEAVKNVLTPGQVSLNWASGVQTPSMPFIWKLRTPVQMMVLIKVAMI